MNGRIAGRLSPGETSGPSGASLRLGLSGKLVHPFLGEKTTLGLIPHLQAALLARFLRGDLDGYPPFFWK